MAAKLFVLVACIALVSTARRAQLAQLPCVRVLVAHLPVCPQSQAAMVRRDAPADSPLQEIQKHAADFQKTFSEQFNSLVNSKNTQELNKALKEGSDSVLQQLSALSSSLQGAVSTLTMSS